MTDAELLAAIAEGRIDARRTLHERHAPWLAARLLRRSFSVDWHELGCETTIMGANHEGFPYMAIEIHDPQAKHLVGVLAELTGEPVETAVFNALRERLEGVQRGRDLDELAVEVASLPTLDARSPEEIIGCDGDGLP